MPTYVVPNWQLANIDPGQLFQNEGKLYMLIEHHALYTEISRYYWFDKLFASAADRIRAMIRRIRIRKIKKGEALEPPALRGTTDSNVNNVNNVSSVTTNNKP